MSVTVINPSGSQNYQAILDCERFQVFAAKTKSLTGRNLVIEFNEDGELIQFLHPDSTQRVGFFVEFFRVGFSSPDGLEAAWENLARRYAELLEELRERYADNEYELYRQIGELNQAFENAMRSTLLLPIPHISPVLIKSTMPQGLRESLQRQMEEQENLQSIVGKLMENMIRHMNTFFESFIKGMQGMDFEAAFSSSMDRLNSTQSSSLANMSFRDVVTIREALSQGHIEEDADGRKVFITRNPITSIRMAIADISISETVRRELADIMGFEWRGGR